MSDGRWGVEPGAKVAHMIRDGAAICGERLRQAPTRANLSRIMATPDGICERCVVRLLSARGD